MTTVIIAVILLIVAVGAIYWLDIPIADVGLDL